MARKRKAASEDDNRPDDPYAGLPTELPITDRADELDAGEPIEMSIDSGAGADDTPFVYDEESPNLVAVFKENPVGEAWLKNFSLEARKKFDEAYESTELYRKRLAEDMLIFSGDLPPKSFPFEGAANAHVPIMLENVTRVVTRLMAELFGDWSNLFSVVSVGGPAGQDEADVLSLHGNWQFREQIRDFDRQMERALLAMICWGDFTVRSYYDEELRCNRHELLTPEEFVIPFTYVTTQPDYSDVPYRFLIMRRYRHQLQAMRDKWEGVDNVVAKRVPDWLSTNDDMVIAESIAMSHKVRIPDSTGAPYKLLQYEGWEQLPNQDRDRFVQAIIDYETGAVLLLTFHEEIDWRDRIRYERQQKEAIAYTLARSQYEDQLAQRDQLDAQVRDQLVNADTMPPQMKTALVTGLSSQPYPDEPPRPSWMKDDGSSEPPPPRKVPIHLFAHGVCIENMTGSLGLSYGRIQADFNRGANVAISQFTDSATIGNCPMLLTTDGVSFARPFKFSPGSVQVVNGVSGQDLKMNIYELTLQPANPQLVQLADKFYGWGQSSMQAPSVLSGEPGKSGETFKGISARIDQATKQLSVVARKFARGPLKQILMNNAKLNSIFLEDQEIIGVLDFRTQTLRDIKIGRELYRRDYNVMIAADLRFASESQKVQEADEMVQMPQAVPQLQGNVAFVYAAVRKALEARNRFDMVQLLGPPPPPPTTPLGMPPTTPPATPGAGPGAMGGGPGGPPAPGPGGPPGPPTQGG
jgi:hypothetical protein